MALYIKNKLIYGFGINDADYNVCKYAASCSVNGKNTYLGLHATPEAAHAAWLKCKLGLAYQLAKEQTDPIIAQAIIERYENYSI